MLKHEVMAADEWHDNGPQELVTVSLCIQIAIDKMQLCSLPSSLCLSILKPHRHHGHSVHNVDISKQLTNTTPYVCHLPGTVETGIHP